MAKNKGGSYTGPTRAEMEAMRAEKFQLVPNGEAGRRERKLLEHYSSAQADLQWIVDNNAWHELGFDTFTGWYTERVRPAVAAAGLRPTQEFALYVLENVRSDETALPKQQRLLQRELADLVGVSVSTLRRLSQDPSETSNGTGADLEDGADPDPADIPDALTQAIRETAAHTSGAVPPASTDSASLALGEPGDSEQAAESPGTQTAADGPHPPTADAVEVPGDRAEEAVAPDGGLVLPSGVTPEELAEEEAAEPPADLPAAATTSLPDGDGDPTPEPEQQPGHNSPTGLEAAQPREGRSETDHQQDAGVSSPAGEAPEVASTDPVEPVELEGGGTAQDPPSSSDPGERLLLVFAEFVYYLDGVDFDAVGPMLRGADLEALHSHVESITAYVGKLGRARFAEMLHTP